MKKRYEPAEVERPDLKNCMRAGFPANTFQASLTEYMIRFNAGGGWRRVYFGSSANGRPQGAPEGADGFFYVRLSDGSITVIEFPDAFFNNTAS